MAASNSPEAVIFDLGGVLIDGDYRYLYRKLLATEADVEWFLAEICTQEWHEQHDRGLPIVEGVARLVSEHPEYAALIEAWDRRFPEIWRGPIEGTVTVVDELRAAGVPLYLLTNWPAEKFPLAKDRFEFIDWFDGAVVSGEVGLVKPDPAIFELLCDRFGLRPSACVFIDDAPRNVEAARLLGFKALRFSTPGQLRVELTALGVLGER